MSYKQELIREGISYNQYNLIVELLEDYTFDAQHLETEEEKQDFQIQLNNELKNLRRYLLKR